MRKSKTCVDTYPLSFKAFDFTTKYITIVSYTIIESSSTPTNSAKIETLLTQLKGDITYNFVCNCAFLFFCSSVVVITLVKTSLASLGWLLAIRAST